MARGYIILPILLLASGLLAGPAPAAVELALQERKPTVIDEVYVRDGVAFLAVDDVLAALEMTGRWNSLDHVYEIQTPYGIARITPANRYLTLGANSVQLSHAPRFIDGRLRVAGQFAGESLPGLLGIAVYYHDLGADTTSDASPTATPDAEEDSLDRFFALLLQKRTGADGSSPTGVLIDPGHGGEDPGSIGLGGLKEKTVALEIARDLEKRIKMQLGVPVHLTRDADYALTLEQRLEAAARFEVDALIQLHAQASPSPEASGIVLFIRPREETEDRVLDAEQGESMHLARCLEAALITAGLKVVKIVPAPLLPLGRGDLPTVLVEMGYLTNAADVAVLTEAENRSRLVLALFDGLKTFTEQRKEID